LRYSSLTQSSKISRKTQEHQEHSMVFGRDFDQTLRTDLAIHYKMKSMEIILKIKLHHVKENKEKDFKQLKKKE
jgi:hypothetical protein